MDRWTGAFTPAVAFALLVLVVSLVPVPDSGGQAVPALLGVALDKWVHAGSYALLTGLAVRARRQRDLLAVAAVAAVVVGYGAGIEVLQSLVPTRDLSPLDALANTAGVVAAGLVLVAAESSSIRVRWLSEQ